MLERSALPTAATARSGVPTAGDCDGLPAVALPTQSPRVRCIALVDDTLSFPRGVVSWGDDLIVADKVSNLIQRSLGSRIGRIYRYRKTATGFARTTLLAGLDNPSAIARGQSKTDAHLLYVATPSAILRFEPDSKEPATTLEIAIADLPTRGWHYITSVHTRADELFVTVPSASDHCETEFAGATQAAQALPYPCPELASGTPERQVTAALRRYRVKPDGTIDPRFRIEARGLRDALALAVDHETGQILAADNGWDDIDLRGTTFTDDFHPPDEINLLQSGAHYGWPYCFAADLVTPGYENARLDCADYEPPLVLLPAHSAPLGMLFLGDHLLVNLHGYRSGGQQTVLFQLDSRGLPSGAPDVLVNWRYPQLTDNSGGRPFGLARYPEQHSQPRAQQQGIEQQIALTDDWNHALLLIMLH